jgi:hypothetical protein
LPAGHERLVCSVQRQLNAANALKNDGSLLSFCRSFEPTAIGKAAGLFKDAERFR